MSAPAEVRLLTPRGVGGIAVVELTGPAAASLLDTCFRGTGSHGAGLEPGRIHYGHVIANGETLDEVIVARVGVPGASDVFEINCHGGIVPARRLMALLMERGAAEGVHGEVMLGRRGRSLERELLGQLIESRTRRAAEVLLVQMSGRLRTALEAVVNDTDETDVRERIERLRATCRYGRRLVEPGTVVITGAPNVGKSTLANAVVGRERSIVHHLPGTTRDVVTSVASLDGLPVVVVDTAGLRQAADEIERIGVERAVERAAGADVVVWVFDHSREVTEDEADHLKILRDMPLVPVINKIDLDGPLDASHVRSMVGVSVQRTCALSGRGVEELRARLWTALVGDDVPARDAAVVTTAGVSSALDEARRRLASGRDTGGVFDAVLD